MFKRRDMIRLAGAATLTGCGHSGTSTATAAPRRNIGDAPLDPSALDRVLTQLHATDPEFDGGLSNHGPMACEALEALGAPEQIEPFYRRYRSRLEPMPKAAPLSDWTTQLGRPEARASLVASMEAELGRAGPEALLRSTLPTLLPGLVGGAFHGLLRTAHAYRAWTRHASTARATELAHGLGYWGARYQPLPGTPGAAAVPGRGALETLERVPVIADDARHAGLIFERFAVLERDTAFADTVAEYDPQAQSPDDALDVLVGSAARLFVSTKSRGASFVYLHGVTGSSALRLLLPVLSEPQQRVAVSHLVQALAAVHATHVQPDSSLSVPAAASVTDPARLAGAAASSNDDHTIKLVEAALREHARSGAPELLAAAERRIG
jgi:hypothetical protein